MNPSAWAYVAHTLEAAMMAALVVVVLSGLLLAVRAYRYRTLRATQEARLWSSCVASVLSQPIHSDGRRWLKDAA